MLRVTNTQPSIQLESGARVVMAIVSKTRPNMEEGIALCETETSSVDHLSDFVVWRIYRWLEGPQATAKFLAEGGQYTTFVTGDEGRRSLAYEEAVGNFQERVQDSLPYLASRSGQEH